MKTADETTTHTHTQVQHTHCEVRETSQDKESSPGGEATQVELTLDMLRSTRGGKGQTEEQQDTDQIKLINNHRK